MTTRNDRASFTDLATVKEVSATAGLADDVMKNIAKMPAHAGHTMTGSALLPGAGDPDNAGIRSRWRAGVSVFTLHYPILNKEKCQGCHGSDHKVRAVVRVATSMEPSSAGPAPPEPPDHDRPRDDPGAAAVLTVAMRSVVSGRSGMLGGVGIGERDVMSFGGARDEIGSSRGASRGRRALRSAITDGWPRIGRDHTSASPPSGRPPRPGSSARDHDPGGSGGARPRRRRAPSTSRPAPPARTLWSLPWPPGTFPCEDRGSAG